MILGNNCNYYKMELRFINYVIDIDFIKKILLVSSFKNIYINCFIRSRKFLFFWNVLIFDFFFIGIVDLK